jgi:two-component system sensor histidine kinase BarA
MNRLGIKYQILLITFIPAFLIDVFFTYSHINTSIEQAQELLQSKGRIISKQIAGASEFNLFSGNNQQIQYVLDQTIDTNDIVFAAVYGNQGDLIANSVSEIYEAEQAPDYYYYHEAIRSQSIALSDVFSPDQIEGPQRDTIGWVHLYISKHRLKNTITDIIYDSVKFFVFVLVMTLILTIIISRGITTPIFKIINHLKRVETGHLGELIKPVEANEIGALQLGFNRMTQALSTNRKHLNDRIQQATQQLSEAITDLETKNRELGFARDEAQNANRIKSEFLANMSHEIRTPINGIKGFINLMGQTDLSSRQKRYADIILKSTNDLTNIIDEILDFSKLESGKLQIVENDFDLYEVIEQTRDILFINVINKSIDLILIIYSDTPRYVSGDKLRLTQVLLNLVGNAIKFTDQGRVIVRVSLEEQSDNEAEILITVEDTGIGISNQDQAELFTAFSQVESAANRRYAGSGLGLVISKNLVNLMGGDITMQSTIGEGSEFAIRLPLSIAVNRQQQTDEEVPSLTAMVLASQPTCLQEIQSLFNRAGVETESVLIGSQYSLDTVIDNIQNNIKFINMIVFDLRHLTLDIDEVLSQPVMQKIKVILIHYDLGIVPEYENQNYEFISNITTSSHLRSLLYALPNKQKSTKKPTSTTESPISKRVLLVDDNPINLKLGGEFIRLWGHQTIKAEHAHEAMVYYLQQTFDLIILDIQMPDIDGTELLSMMRKEKPDEKTLVVELTAKTLHK